MSTLEHFPLRIDVLISHNYRMTWYSIHLIWFGHNIPSLPPHIPPDQRCQGIFLHLFCMSMWLWSFNHATSTVFNISLVRMQAPIVPYIMICLTVIPQGLDASTNCQYHMKVQTQLRQTNIIINMNYAKRQSHLYRYFENCVLYMYHSRVYLNLAANQPHKVFS